MTIPKLIAPAMNTKMYQNPITQDNIKRLSQLGFTEIPPKTSLLACGDTGPGALADLDVILEAIETTLKS